jgi:hypothetical protein
MALEALQQNGYQVEFHSHALAILGTDFPDAIKELESALLSQSIPIAEIIGSGGGETKGTQRLRKALSDLGWAKYTFEIKKIINQVERAVPGREAGGARNRMEQQGPFL